MKQDHKLISSKQTWEPSYIADKYNIPIEEVKQTMIECGKDGKPSRSRAKVYAALRDKGYIIETSKKKDD